MGHMTPQTDHAMPEAEPFTWSTLEAACLAVLLVILPALSKGVQPLNCKMVHT